VSLVCCFRVEREKARPETSARQGGERERPKRRKPQGIEYRRGWRAGGLARSSGEAPVMGVERRGVRRDKPAWRRRWKSSTPKA